MGRIRFTSSAVALLCCLVATAAQGQQVSFRQVHAPGDKFTFSQNTALELNISAAGQQMQQSMSQVRSGTMTVDAVDTAGKITRATISFGQDCGETMDGGPMMGGRQTQPSPLAGKTITVIQNGNDPKDLRFEGANVDATAAQEIVQMFRNDNSMMPTTPVAVGETWKLDASQLQALVPPGTEGDLQGAGKVTGISNVNGRETAMIDLDATVTGNSPQGRMSMKFAGRGAFDTQTSRPIELQLSGPFTASGQEMGPQGPMQMEIRGQVNIALKSTIAGKPIARPDIAPPVIAPPRGDDGPVAGGVVARNPLDDDAPAAPAMPSGIYTDGKLTLTLDRSGTGSIKLGDREFAMDETMFDVNSNVLNGWFSAGDQRFPFTAAFRGDQCEFESGTRKSTLKKQAARNPLDD